MKNIFIYQGIDSKGGSKKSLFNFVKLISQDVRFSIVNGTDGWFSEETKNLSFKHYIYKEPKFLNRRTSWKNSKINKASSILKFLVFGWKNCYKNYRVMKQDNIDVVILNEPRDVFQVGLPAAILRKKKISFIRGEVSLIDYPRLIMSNKLIALSNNLIKNLPKLLKSKALIIPNYIVTPENIEQKNAPKVNSQTLRIAFAGSLIPVKGLEHLLEIADLLKDQPIQINIYGDFIKEGNQSYKNKIIRTINSKGLNQKLSFFGWVEDVETIYSDNDVLILTSNSEGLPRVVLEAMAFKKPIVTFKVGGVEDLVKNNINGFVLKHGDYESFAKKLVMLLNDKNMVFEMGQESYAMVNEKFNKDIVRKKLLEVIYY